jgi:hypothetical protein
MKKFILFFVFVFISLNTLFSATFTSRASTGWNTATTWSVTLGTDANGIPDLDDIVIISNGHSVSLSAGSTFKSLLISPTGTLVTNNQQLFAYGDITIQGKLSGSPIINIQANSIFNSTQPYLNNGDWYVRGGNLTISAGVTISRIAAIIIISNNRTVTNNGNVSTKCLARYGSGRWINAANSTLTTISDNTGVGVITATAVPNTVIYNNVAIKTIEKTNYYNLTINGASTKSIQGTPGTVTVANDFTLNNGTLNLNSNNLTVGGNWTNNANTTLTNQGLISFNSSTSQTISRTGSNETFSNMTVSGTGTTLLNCNLTINQNLTVSSGTLDVGASNFTINVKGNMINNSFVNCRAGTVNMNGSALQSISGSANTRFFNLTLANASGLIINSAQSLSNILTVSSGNFNSNGNFTLLSDASTTARIAPVGGTLSNAMIIQKFISGRAKGWHDLSSPVQATTINDWDDEMYMSGIGPYDGVVGPAGVDGNTGASFNSVYTYQESTANYIAVSGSTTPLAAGTGYEIWLADDQTSWFAKVIDTRGVPNFGTVVIPCSFAGPASAKGYNLIGNPFASAITFSACTRTNVNANILLLDGSGNVTSYGANATIPAHQGFWVIANGASASISIPESAKSTDVTTSHFRKNEDYGIKLLFSTPMLSYYNENTINFESNATLGFDNDLDAPYIKSPIMSAPAMFMLNNENDGQMITNAISGQEDEVVIPLGYYTPLEGTYYIQPNILNTNGYDYIWIENTKTGKKFDLNNSSLPVEGKEDSINRDYVLHLSKLSKSSAQTLSAFANDLTIFNVENLVNIKANNADHILQTVSIYDLSGKLMLEQASVLVNAGNTEGIDISTLAKGMYIVTVIDENGNRLTKKIIK